MLLLLLLAHFVPSFIWSLAEYSYTAVLSTLYTLHVFLYLYYPFIPMIVGTWWIVDCFPVCVVLICILSMSWICQYQLRSCFVNKIIIIIIIIEGCCRNGKYVNIQWFADILNPVFNWKHHKVRISSFQLSRRVTQWQDLRHHETNSITNQILCSWAVKIIYQAR